MQIEVLLKIAGVGLLVTVICQALTKAGREDIATVATVAGILIVVLMPITRAIVGRAVGNAAVIVPLIIAAFPFVARLVEGSLREVNPNIIEAAQSMGATKGQIIMKVLLGEARTSLLVGVTIALGTILGYSAMAGIVGGGGLGDIAIRYGYYRYETGVMLITVGVLVLLMQVLQWTGMLLSRKIDRRRTA